MFSNSSKFIQIVFAHLFLSAFFLIFVQNRKLSQDCLKCDRNHTFSFFWKIERAKPSPPSYFFGTIHAPYTKVWDYVPSKAKSAFRNSSQIIFELDLMNADTLLSLTRCQLLPPGILLSDVIPIDLYHRLQRHLKYVKYKMPLWITEEQRSRGLYASNLYNAITMHWERKRPIWVMIMLNSLTENDIKSKGITVLDSFFYQKAKKLKKSIGSVENAKEQCKTLNYLNSTQVVYALNQTLVQHESIRRGIKRSNHTTDDMIHHYNCGNLNEALFNEDSANIPVLKNDSVLIPAQELEIAKNIENYFRFEIILKRNKRMSRKVLELLTLKPKESFFFIFGAGHFLGKDSIIELIKDQGLEIVHINDTQQKHSLICDTSSSKSKVSHINPKRTMINNERERQTISSASFIYPVSPEYRPTRPLFSSSYPSPSYRSYEVSSDIASYYDSFASFPSNINYDNNRAFAPYQNWPQYRRSSLVDGQHQHFQRFHLNHGPYPYNDLSPISHNNKNFTSSYKWAALFAGYGPKLYNKPAINESSSKISTSIYQRFLIHFLLFFLILCVEVDGSWT